MTFKADTKAQSCLYRISLWKVSLVCSYKHLPDSHGTQITAYFCMQLASKTSSLISSIIHGTSQPISLYFRVLKRCKIQRENILKRPIPRLVEHSVDVGLNIFYSEEKDWARLCRINSGSNIAVLKTISNAITQILQ